MAKEKNRMVKMLNSKSRTRYRGGLLEDLGDLRVHLDHEVLLDSHLFVARRDLGLHPVGELVLEDGRADVGEPLLRRLRELDVGLWQVIVDLRVRLVEELSDLLHAEALVPNQ